MSETQNPQLPCLKAKVTLEAIQGVRTAAEIAKVCGVHSNLVALWESNSLDQLPSIFPDAEAPRPVAAPKKDAFHQDL